LDGTYQLVGKDILKLTDDERAQAPLLSGGFITGEIVANEFTLSPTGIGDIEYPASGYVAIGGKEICAFTRAGDVMSLTRGQLGTEEVTHDSGERVQIVLSYTAEDPADIIAYLLQNYANIPSEYIPLAAWQAETGSFVQTLYSAYIAEPTSVKTLVAELAEQASLALWWEPLIPEIRLKVIRKIPTDAETYTESSIMEGSLSIEEQPDSRITQVWTYFGQRNPLRPVDEADNYRSVAATVNLEAETDFGGASIKKIFSRWIPFGARSVALRLNDLILTRYATPPRRCAFSLWKHSGAAPMLGGGYQVGAWVIQNQDGSSAYMPIQLTRLNPTDERFDIEAEEMLAGELSPEDLTNRALIIDGDINNVNLRTLHDSIYPEITGTESPKVTLSVYVETNVIVGSTSTSAPALDVGTWVAGSVDITIYVRGRLQGAGGDGGDAALDNGEAGAAGGTALYSRYAVTLELSTGGYVWGGGGGGGGGGANHHTWLVDYEAASGGGGGGQGRIGGAGGLHFAGNNGTASDGYPGTSEAPGDGGGVSSGYATGGVGGNGGGPGAAGAAGTKGPGSGSAGAGGAGGPAIDGVSYVTKIGAGDIHGSEIN
jgi:hypothetical protein